MSEKTLRIIFVVGTITAFVVLAGMTVNSLSTVRSVRTAPLTDDVVAGKAVWQSRNCNDCHTILGIGAYFAPELTTVADRRDAAWLSDFLLQPAAAKPGTTMPDQRLTARDARALVAFFQWVSGIDTNEWPPAPRTAVGTSVATSEGALVFERKGCSACHMVAGTGAAGPGPDLTHIGSTPYDDLPNTPEFLARWLEDPQAEKPGTTMPATPLTEAERNALVDYLVSLK
ncbi:MAG: cytochrome c [Gemmatimonadales bacterium]|jgi:nitric oxide reductase subunit C